ncbi:MAG: flagellar protein FliT [Porticoccaceae bacterium]
MLIAAEGGNWEKVAEIESTRSEEIAICLARTEVHENVAAVADSLRTLMAIDQRIILLATTGMDGLRDKLGTLRTGRIALQAYEFAGAG